MCELRTSPMSATADAIIRTLESPNVSDTNLENANVVDVIAALASATRRVADAITPIAVPAQDASGGSVASLTEAAIGITGGLHQIANAIRECTEAMRDRNDQ